MGALRRRLFVLFRSLRSGADPHGYWTPIRFGHDYRSGLRSCATRFPGAGACCVCMPLVGSLVWVGCVGFPFRGLGRLRFQAWFSFRGSSSVCGSGSGCGSSFGCVFGLSVLTCGRGRGSRTEGERVDEALSYFSRKQYLKAGGSKYPIGRGVAVSVIQAIDQRIPGYSGNALGGPIRMFRRNHL